MPTEAKKYVNTLTRRYYCYDGAFDEFEVLSQVFFSKQEAVDYISKESNVITNRRLSMLKKGNPSSRGWKQVEVNDGFGPSCPGDANTYNLVVNCISKKLEEDEPEDPSSESYYLVFETVELNIDIPITTKIFDMRKWWERLESSQPSLYHDHKEAI